MAYKLGILDERTTLGNLSEYKADITLSNMAETIEIMKGYKNALIMTHLESDKNTQFKLDREIDQVTEWLRIFKNSKK